MIGTSFTVPSGTDRLLAFIVLRDAASNVGMVTDITSSCGGVQHFIFGARGRSHSTGSALHNVEGWELVNPAAGTCNIEVVTAGTFTSWILDIAEANVGSGTSAWSSNGSGGVTSSVPTVTVPTNTSETIFAATSGSSGVTVSVGSNQTPLVDIQLSPMRLFVSSQNGTAGGVMDYIFG